MHTISAPRMRSTLPRSGKQSLSHCSTTSLSDSQSSAPTATTPCNRFNLTFTRNCSNTGDDVSSTSVAKIIPFDSEEAERILPITIDTSPVPAPSSQILRLEIEEGKSDEWEARRWLESAIDACLKQRINTNGQTTRIPTLVCRLTKF